MRLRALIHNIFTKQERPAPLHIAILAPRSSGTVEKTINLTLQYLRAHTTRPIKVTQFNNVTDQAQFMLFVREAEQARFDLIFALTGLAAAQARQIYVDHGIVVPTLITTHQELLPHPMPNHISALLAVNDAPFIFHLLTTSTPKIKKILICTHTVLAQRSQEIADLRSLCAGKNIEVVTIPLPLPLHELALCLQEHAPTAQVLFMPVDSEAFGMAPDIIEQAHTYGCRVLASELLAIRYGADLAFGYPLERFAAECGQRLLHILQYPKRDIRFVQTTREVHCRSTQQDMLLRTLATPQIDHHFKIIGCTDNKESEQDQ